jgi:hypothetical protein
MSDLNYEILGRYGKCSRHTVQESDDEAKDSDFVNE